MKTHEFSYIRQIVLLLSLLAFALSVNNVFASVVFDNGMDGLGIAYGSANTNAYASADDFMFSSEQVITDLHWRGVYTNNASTEYFMINIHNQAASTNTPTAFGDYIYSFSTNVYTAVNSGQNYSYIDVLYIYDFSADIDPFVAEAGKTYWLEIFSVNPTGNWYWITNSAMDGNGVQTHLNGQTIWEPVDGEFAFQLTNDSAPIPEPSTFILLGAGLAGLAVWRKKRS
jgi:hypothetical protein